MLGVLKYLTSQGILIEGLETAGEEAKEPEHKKFLLQQKKKLILKIIWRNCRLLMRWDADSVFEALAAGDQRALQTLTSYYMKTAADMAVEMNIEEMQAQRDADYEKYKAEGASGAQFRVKRLCRFRFHVPAKR